MRVRPWKVVCALVAVTALMAMVGSAPVNAAGTERIPVSAHIGFATELIPDRIGPPPNFTPVFQYWNGTGVQWWEGDPYLQGMATVEASFTATGLAVGTGWKLVGGRLWGSMDWQPYAFDGGWRATFSFKITSVDAYGFSYSGKVVGHGYGDLDGYELMLEGGADGTIPPEEGSHYAIGYVLVPGGG